VYGWLGLGLADVLGGLFVGISAVSVYRYSKRFGWMLKIVNPNSLYKEKTPTA
jgi:hypothetical protein